SLGDAMTEDIVEALRNGLAHTYDTKYIQAGKLKIEIVVSWKRMDHLSVDKTSPALFLNIRTMREDLRRAFAEVASRLEASPPSEVPREWKSKQISQAQSNSVAPWKKLFENGSN
ncbi:MAG: hypothetical protein LC674_04720, partial [Actinobacteria bacterium]|nr:hypothetical protein [Actinomycetota bacterium]